MQESGKQIPISRHSRSLDTGPCESQEKKEERLTKMRSRSNSTRMQEIKNSKNIDPTWPPHLVLEDTKTWPRKVSHSSTVVELNKKVGEPTKKTVLRKKGLSYMITITRKISTRVSGLHNFFYGANWSTTRALK